MVVGKGLLGMSFLLSSENDNNDRIIFASGVSNSKETNIEEFEREKNLILINIKSERKFIYFSSVLSDVINNPYYQHKLEMEELIKSSTKNYLIFRVPQIVGYSGNSNNLIKNFSRNMKDGNKITIHEGIKRSLIDVTDLVRIVNYCDSNSSCLTLNLSFIELIGINELYEKIRIELGLEENFSINSIHEDYNWITTNSTLINEAIDELKINRIGYTDKIIKKYIK